MSIFDYIQLRVDSYPRDASGTTTLEILRCWEGRHADRRLDSGLY